MSTSLDSSTPQSTQTPALQSFHGFTEPTSSYRPSATQSPKQRSRMQDSPPQTTAWSSRKSIPEHRPHTRTRLCSARHLKPLRRNPPESTPRKSKPYSTEPRRMLGTPPTPQHIPQLHQRSRPALPRPRASPHNRLACQPTAAHPQHQHCPIRSAPPRSPAPTRPHTWPNS